MLTVVFANGRLSSSSFLAGLLAQAELIVAADGGANGCRRLQILPDRVIGDLDSIEPSLLARYERLGVTIRRYPRRKDATDLELALDEAFALGATSLWIVGGLGRRWDMSIATILLAAAEKYAAARLSLLGPGCIMHVLHGGRTYHLTAEHGRRVSFVALRDDVRELTLEGFEYPLAGATLAFASTLGVSNLMLAPTAAVRHAGGVLLAVQEEQAR